MLLLNQILHYEIKYYKWFYIFRLEHLSHFKSTIKYESFGSIEVPPNNLHRHLHNNHTFPCQHHTLQLRH